MDPVSISVSVLALIELSVNTLSTCCKYISKARKAPEEITRAISEINSLKGILEALSPLVNCTDSSQYRCLNSSTGSDNPFTACNAALQLIHAQLQQIQDASSVRAKLLWPIVEKKLSEGLNALEKSKSTFIAALAGETFTIVDNLMSEMKKTKLDEKRSKVLSWLRSGCADSSTNFNAARKLHDESTCQWVLNGEIFKTWLKSDSEVLWIRGIPGAGKTILCSAIIEHLRREGKLDHGQYLAYYFFDFSNQLKRTALGCLKSLFVQICEQQDSLDESVVKCFDYRSGGELDLDDVTMLLANVLSKIPGSVLVIDALDECLQEDERPIFYLSLDQIRTTASKIRVLITSRSLPDISIGLEGLSPLTMDMKKEEVDADIRIYVQSCLKEDPKLRKWPPKVKQGIEDNLTKKSSGMFRWVFCQLHVLRKCLKERLIQEALATLPEGLDETYKRIFLSMPSEYRDEIKTIMAFLAFSTRPMTIQEIAEATAIRIQKGVFAEAERFPDPYDLLELCPGLLTLSPLDSEAGNQFSKERGHIYNIPENVKILQFAHLSVKEFVISERMQAQLPAHLALGPSSSNLHITRACLSYILCFNDGKMAREFKYDQYPLLAYTTLHWKTHWDAVDTEDKAKVSDLLLRLFDTSQSQALTNYLNIHNPSAVSFGGLSWLPGLPHMANKRSAMQGSSALLHASYFGFESIVRWLLDSFPSELDANALANALAAASLQGHDAAVELLLGCGADPNACTEYFSLEYSSFQIATPLQAAAYHGSAVVTKRLIEAGAEVNEGDIEKGSALHVAARRGNDQAIEMLVDGGANMHFNSNKYGAPLCAAATKGNNSTVVLLLRRGADPNKGWSTYYGTALESACMSCSFEVVEALVEAGADLKGQMMLYHASERGELDMMRFLIVQGADVNAQVGTYGSPLQAAIQSRNIEAFELLVSMGADVLVEGGCNKSAIGQAVFSHNLPVIQRLLDLGVQPNDVAILEAIDMDMVDTARLLLDRGADPNTKTSKDRYESHGNALQLAIARGRDQIALLLLEHGASVNEVAGELGTPLQAACQQGSLTLVQKILSRGARINTTSSCGRYGHALTAAVLGKNVDIVELLLQHGADANALGGEIGTALIAAIEYNREAVIPLLLSAGADVNIKAGECGSALGAALATGNKALAQMLIERGANCTEEIDAHCVVREDGGRGGGIDGFRWLVEMAACLEDTSFMQMLLDNGADLNCQGKENEVLAYAAGRVGLKMVKFLLEKGANAKANGGRALKQAMRSPEDSRLELVRILVQHGSNLNEPFEEYYGSPLHIASRNGNADVVRFLVDAGANINDKRCMYGTPLQVAIEAGNVLTAQLLLRHGVDVNVVAGHEGCALLTAICKNDEEMFHLLLSSGADVNVNGGKLGTPLEAALSAGQIEFAKELLSKGADPLAKGLYTTPLIPAAHVVSAKGTEFVSHLISLGVDMNAVDDFAGSALIVASWRGNKATVQLLLESGADINVQGGEYGTPLQAAAMGGRTAMVDFLLSQGADVNIVAGRKLGTALMAAIWQEDAALVQLLLNAGADVNVEGGMYGSPLQVAARLGQPDIAKTLLEKGARMQTNIGWYGSPLHAAAKWGRLSTFNMLLEHGADIYYRGGKHGSVLQAAACGRNEERSQRVIKRILEIGADVNSSGGCYGTALQAAACRSEETVKLLIEHGAEVNAKGGRFGTALNAAKKKGHRRIQEILLEHGAREDLVPSDFEVPKTRKPDMKCWLIR